MEHFLRMAVLRPKSSGQFRGLVGVRNQESGYPIGSYRQDLEAVDTDEIRGVVGEQRNVQGQRCGGRRSQRQKSVSWN
jgi:hypothetical protein